MEDLNAWLDRPVKARIIEADMEKGKLVLSAREVIREQQREEKRRKVEDVKVGEVRKGTVESLQSYGAFVDLGDGISGLLHISQISTQRKPYYSFVALSVLLDDIVRRYIEHVEHERRESLQDQVDDALNAGDETDA